MKTEFELPKWKKIEGQEHILSNWNLEYDLLGIEEFINNMIGLGWCPTQISWGTRFSFVPCAPGEFICRTAQTMTKNGFFDKQKAADLTDLLARDGATIIPQKMTLGSQIGLIVIRPAALGSFEINSDLDSRIAEYEARKKSSEGLAGGFFAISVCYVSLSITLEAMTGLMGLALAFLAFAFAHYRPVPRYKKIIKKLKAERDISEI